jgi:hypothetical protein
VWRKVTEIYGERSPFQYLREEGYRVLCGGRSQSVFEKELMWRKITISI